MSEFFKTLMGRKFYEHDIPALLKVLGNVSTNLERIAKALEALTSTLPPPPSDT